MRLQEDIASLKAMIKQMLSILPGSSLSTAPAHTQQQENILVQNKADTPSDFSTDVWGAHQYLHLSSSLLLWWNHESSTHRWVPFLTHKQLRKGVVASFVQRCTRQSQANSRVLIVIHTNSHYSSRARLRARAISCRWWFHSRQCTIAIDISNENRSDDCKEEE